MKLKAEELMEGLTSPSCLFRSLSPRRIPQAKIDRCINTIRRTRLELNSDDENLCAFADLVAEPLKLAQPQFRSAISECEIYILPYSICTAYSARIDRRKIIVIGSGMIDLIETVSYSAHVIGALSTKCLHLFPIEELTGMSLLDIVNQFLFVLLFRYFYHDDFLPNIKVLADERMIHDARVSFAGGMAFVLLHELAHIELHHSERNESCEIDIHPNIHETLSDSQKQEHEADQAAIGFIEPQFQEIGHFWRNSAFDFFARLELMSGLFNDTHPLALNRIFQLDECIASQTHFYDTERRKRHNLVLAEAFKNAAKTYPYGPDHMLNISRDTCFAILSQIRMPLLQAGGPDVAPMFLQSGPSWRKNLAKEGLPWETV